MNKWRLKDWQGIQIHQGDITIVNITHVQSQNILAVPAPKQQKVP